MSPWLLFFMAFLFGYVCADIGYQFGQRQVWRQIVDEIKRHKRGN